MAHMALLSNEIPVFKCRGCLAFLLLSSSFLTSSNAFSTSRYGDADVRWGRNSRPVCLSRTESVTFLHHGRPSRRHHTSLQAVTPQDEEKKDRKLGFLVLFTVPLAWGTFEPAVRFIYEMDPPVPNLLFSFAYYLVAATSLAILSITTSVKKRDQSVIPMDEQLPLSNPIRGGIELGAYLFVGNWLQVLGLKTVSSDRAAFLLQLTTIFVPLVQGIFNGDLRSIQRKTWIACGIALLGVIVITLDGKEDHLLDSASNILTNFSEGDLYVIAAAFSYTFHCIRLEGFAKESPAIELATWKAITETTLTVLLIGCIYLLSNRGSNLLSAQEAMHGIETYLQSDLLSNPDVAPTALAITWIGLVTVAYTICAQSFGQSRVSPTDANLIYTFQPIYTAIFAWALLGETLGPAGYVGGALIASSVYMVAVNDGDNANGIS